MITVTPMDEQHMLLTCLHEGPIDKENWVPPFETEDVNLPPHPWNDQTLHRIAERCPGISHGNCHSIAGQEFFREMIQRYGTCALVARQDDRVVGSLRFFPLKIARLVASSQTDPSPVVDCLLAGGDKNDDGALWVQCVMTSMPYENAKQARKAGARRGVGQQLVNELKIWAKQHGWKRIVKIAHCDLDWFYGIQGGGGKSFWEKAGFHVEESIHKRSFDLSDDAEAIVRGQMDEKGLAPEDIWLWHRMVWEA